MNGIPAPTVNALGNSPLKSAGWLGGTQRHLGVLASAEHWPEYLMEAAELALFMISACSFTVLLEHPASPVHQMLPNPLLRMALVGIAMGLTLLGLIHTPWGKRSGAHMNP